MAGDVSKLPKWAQQRIQQLEREVESLTAKLSYDKLAEQGKRSNTFADPYFDATNPDSLGVPLGRDTLVAFYVENKSKHDHSRFYCNLDSDRHGKQFLRVHGSDSFVIRPSSANVVEVALRER